MTFQNKKPNFLLIVADDLGFSDLGSFGSEISTPNLDALAMDGLRLANFYTASACSPTRSMLFSGTDNHIAGLGQMAEFVRRNPGPFAGKPGYEGYLNSKIAALPEILSAGGYDTIMSGKWHLGLQPEETPHARGFQKSFSLLPGAGNHYKYFPTLKEEGGDTAAIKFMPPIYAEDDRFIDPGKELPDNFYSTDYFTDRLIGFLEDTTQNEEAKPWFAALTYTAPHWPLQAPQDLIDKYRGRYDAGPGVLREQRLRRLKDIGLIKSDVTPHPVIAPLTKEWEDSTTSEKEISARNMEVYAAMVERMDWNIGRVIAHLKSSGELENTFILFMSDNGAEGALLEAVPLLSAHLKPVLKKYYNNTLENIGRKDSFTWYGPRWAQASTAPSRMYKAHIADGGIHCPAIVYYPPLVTDRDRISTAFTTVMDILPTVLSLAEIPHPAPSFQGRTVVAPRGKSLVPHLKGESAYVHGEETITGWELFGQQAIRQGSWKAIFVPKPAGPEKWQVYNLEEDPGETKDLAKEKGVGRGREKLAELVKYWTDYVSESGVVELTAEDREEMKGEYGLAN
ncbi:hypothetical protein RUND412_009806 [Rhizina undulata]